MHRVKNRYFAEIYRYCYLDGLSIHGAWSILKTFLDVVFEIFGSEKIQNSKLQEFDGEKFGFVLFTEKSR